MADRKTRELALAHAVTIEAAGATGGMSWDANRAVAVAELFEKYLDGEAPTEGGE